MGQSLKLVYNASTGKVLIYFQVSPSSSLSSLMSIDSFDLQIMHTCSMNENCNEGLHCETYITIKNLQPRCMQIKPVNPLKGLHCPFLKVFTNSISNKLVMPVMDVKVARLPSHLPLTMSAKEREKCDNMHIKLKFLSYLTNIHAYFM